MLRQDGPNAHPKEAVDTPHPVGVATSEVIVHRHHMHALAGQRIEIDRQRRHERFALACTHLGNLALMQRHAAHELHVKVTHFQHATARLANHSKRLGQQCVKRFALADALLEFRRFAAQLVIGEGFDTVFERVGLDDLGAVLLEQAVVATAENRF